MNYQSKVVEHTELLQELNSVPDNFEVKFVIPRSIMTGGAGHFNEFMTYTIIIAPR